MDTRLDFYNHLNKYHETLGEDDSLIVLAHNRKEGDCIISSFGDFDILADLFTIEGYVNLTEGSQENYENVKKTILNIAFNICRTHPEIKNKFIENLTK